MNKLIAAICFTVAIGSGTAAFWIHIKSVIGQVLLAQAWQNTVATGGIKRAWPWADTWPVAQLVLPDSNQSLIVLEGVSGEAMAFGPGRVPESSATAAAGTYVIGGHRDSHLKFLQHVGIGDSLALQTADGAKTDYKVSEWFIANAESGPLNLPKDLHALVLITCYPFHALQTGGPLRYVVIAVPEGPLESTISGADHIVHNSSFH